MLRLFWSEYRRHPFWAAMLVVLLAVGLVLDFALIPRGAPLTSPMAGVLRPGSTVQTEPAPYRPA